MKINPGTKFESHVFAAVHLLTLEQGMYSVLVTEDIETLRIVRLRHMTFDENTFPGAQYLSDNMDDGSPSDSKYAGHDSAIIDSDKFSIDGIEYTIADYERGTADPSDDTTEV